VTGLTIIQIRCLGNCIRFLNLHNTTRAVKVNNTKSTTTMRWVFSFLLLAAAAVVQAVSSGGNKLLIVLEELADKSKYSKYLGDLEGKY
jgi:hypothetical protein